MINFNSPQFFQFNLQVTAVNWKRLKPEWFQPLPRLPLPSDSPTTDANSSPGLLGRSVLGLSYHLRRLQVQH